MVREENVKLMSRIAIYERNKGREEIAISSFYKGDYVRLHSLKAVVSATIAFALVFAMGIFYKMDYIKAGLQKNRIYYFDHLRGLDFFILAYSKGFLCQKI